MNLELRQVAKSYRLPGGTGDAVRVIRGVDLAVSSGEYCRIEGPSGSGKSTLLALVAGLAFPDGGEILWGGVPVRADRSLARRRGLLVGYAYQEGGFFPELTVMENLLAPAFCAGLTVAAREAETLLERFGLAEVFDSVPARLSGGEKRRLALARALIHGPPLLILDEPTAYLDREWGERAMELLLAARRETGATLVVAAHGELPGGRPDRVLRMAAGMVTEVTDGDH